MHVKETGNGDLLVHRRVTVLRRITEICDKVKLAIELRRSSDTERYLSMLLDLGSDLKALGIAAAKLGFADCSWVEERKVLVQGDPSTARQPDDDDGDDPLPF